MCVVVSIHFQKHFKSMRFRRKLSAYLCGRKAYTHLNVCVFKRKRISVDEGLTLMLFAVALVVAKAP